jgi:nucleoside-diphosphate-sugar epimerase
VTGASGFVGGYVCADLTARGHAVTALVRRSGSAPEGVAEVVGDLGAAGPALGAAVAGAAPECVVHLAAEIASQRSAERIRAVNVEGTRRLIDACVAAGSPRFVFASTVVTGDAHGALLDEQSPLPVQTAYGRSKQEGERLVRESALPSAIVRPSHVYGAGGWYVEEFVTRLRQAGRFAVIGRGDNRWDVVRVEDVATALGVGPPRSIPAPIARLAGGRDPVLAVTRSARSSNALVKRELGWSPRYPTATVGVPDAVARIERLRPPSLAE